MVFTGRAIYDSMNGAAVFDGVAEDVSDLITMISPTETPLLDRIGDGAMAAQSVKHEWLEDALNPSTLVCTVNVASVTTTTSALFTDSAGNAMAPHLQVGMQLKFTATGEYVQLTAIDRSNNVVQFNRAFGSTSASSAGAGTAVFVIGPVQLEGADIGEDLGRARVRKENYCQIFEKAVRISGTAEAVSNIGIGSELEYQTAQRMKELLLDFEKTVVHGLSSGNSLGSSTAYRSMRGLWNFLETNVTTTGATSVTPGWLNDVIKTAWSQGDVPNLIVADANWRAIIDGFNSSRITVDNGSPTTYRNKVTLFESSYGLHEVITSRWVPANSLMVLSTDRIKILPLKGRSFQMREIAPTGDAKKRHIIGEYTLEVRNENSMCKAFA